MTLVITANVAGHARGEPTRLSNRRRRLSTIVARHRPPAGRRFIVSVHRKGDVAYRPNDRAVRLKAQWSRTLVGPNDVVLITVVPLGRGVASIGLAIASIALIAIAPYAAPGIAAGLAGAGIAVSAGVVQAGLVIGGIALSYAAQASAAAKKKTENPLYSVSGGGNIPKANGRRPLLYGRSWSSPPLSQKDYFSYDGDTMVLVKRMTLGIGKFQVHRVRVGDALYWDEASGLQAPFNLVTGPLGAAFEILYETPSAISPGDVITSSDVGGQEMPRPGENPAWTPWFRLCPPGVTADAMQVSHTYPAIYRVASSGAQKPTVAAVTYQAREIDPNTGNVIGPEFVIWRSDEGGNALTVTPLRRSVNFRLPKANAAYEIRAQNAYPAPVGFIQENRATWDEMVAFKDDVRVRPQTTEICMRVRAGKGLTVTAFSDISVDATRIVPVWNGTSWVEQPTSKAVWAFCDLVRAEYGLDQPDGVDADKALTYANLLPAFDTYDGQLPEVASFWEAAAEVLQPLRADPVKVGAIHSFVRDESRAEPRHVLTRRQIVRDSGGATYRPKVEGSDVIVEFDRDGDPKRPDEVRYAYGPQTRTPKRYKVAGIRDGAHAQKHAAWLALVAVFRGSERRITTEWDGRLVFPGDHILSDLWFFQGKQAYGVASRTGTVLQLDVTANVPAMWGYVSIRTRVGREWGILRARGVGPRGLELHPDDVPALEAKTGLSLGSVLATDSQDPTTVVLGDLTELQESYVARSAVPSDADHVQIEMVRDDVRIWRILGETVYQPTPVNDDGLEEPLVPQISVLHARCDRIETGIEVIWGVSITRGARNYEADISYDQGVTWDVLSPFGPASTGRAQMRQIDGPVTVRARAYGRTGLHGDYVTTTFTTVAPVVDGAQTGIVNLPPIDYAGLTDAVRAKIDHILTVEAQANAKASDLLARVLSAAAVGDANTASITNESQTRLGADTALAGDLSAAVVRIGAAEAGAITERSARIDGDTVQAQRTDAVIVRTAAAEAFGLSEQTARVNADGALSSRLDVVSAAVGSNASAIVAERQARADAISAEAARTEGLRADVVNGFNALSAGISQESQVRAASDAAFASQATDLYARSDAGTAVGRFSMQAVSNPSGVSARIQALLATTRGGQTYGAGYYLDLMADGTSRFVVDANAFYITANGQTAPALSFDGYTLTIPSLRVTNSVFLPDSVSKSGWSITANTSVDFTIGVRSNNSKIKIHVQFDGNPSGAALSAQQLGRLQILRDGTVIRDIPINYYANGSPVRFYSLQTSGFVWDVPGGGSHTYTVRNTGNQGPISYMYEEITA